MGAAAEGPVGAAPNSPRPRSAGRAPAPPGRGRPTGGEPADPGRRRGLVATLLLTVLAAIVPGSGLIIGGRRKTGAAVLAATIAGVGFVAWYVLTDHRTLLRMAVEPAALVRVAVILAAVGVGWVVVLVCSHRSLRPADATGPERFAGSVLVGLLSLAVIAPFAFGTRDVLVQRDVVSKVFASEQVTADSPTTPKHATKADPWAGQSRINLLLLGSDAGPDRVGVRTDTMILASIDTRTGNTVLISLPRNLERAPFPPGSALAQAYGGSFYGPGNPANWMLNAVYRLVPLEHPGIMGASRYPGADALKLAVGQITGLRVDYFLMINFTGFEKLVNILGGVTVNVNQRVAIGGDVDTGTPPKSWIEPGPDQHLDGFHALWFARGRFGSQHGDFDRMARQRCLMSDIIDQANPVTVLRKYEALAAASEKYVQTDIPAALLPAFVDLSLKVKDAHVGSIVVNPSVTSSANPDFAVIRDLVQRAIAAGGASAKGTHPPTTTQPHASGEPSPSASPTPTPSASPPPTLPTEPSISQACSYHP